MMPRLLHAAILLAIAAFAPARRSYDQPENIDLYKAFEHGLTG
jgi:hypothetical protein